MPAGHEVAKVEMPDSSELRAQWGSDLIAQSLRGIGFPYVCLVPGASYRGLHDSLVNHLGNVDPQMIVCLHEEHAVAIAHGYAKVMDRPLAVLLHANVGLLHASMALFNAWCDRAPVVAIGATGPLDAARRRPWIDWIHTSIDQGAAVRGFVKWDDQPASPEAAVEALHRATMIAGTRPFGPVYVNIDSSVQEQRLERPPAADVSSIYQAPRAAWPNACDIDDACVMIAAARNPVILCGRASRDVDAWQQRIVLAERLEAPVFVEYNSAATFPRSHRLFAGALRFSLKGSPPRELEAADLVISLDWTDAGGTLAQLWSAEGPRPAVIACSNDHHVHRGWNMDYQKLPYADLRIAATPESLVEALLQRELPARDKGMEPRRRTHRDVAATEDGILDLVALSQCFVEATDGLEVSLVSNPLGWPSDATKAEHPLDFLGSNGGGGLGAGPGIAIGAALALRDQFPDRLAVAILGDGDYLMGVNALWTAAKYNIPVLLIVANNRSYFNDETHQEHVAQVRDRPVENKWIGQRLDDPAPDLAMLARAQGVEGAGPVEDMNALRECLAVGLRAVRAGRPYVIDARVSGGYAG